MITPLCIETKENGVIHRWNCQSAFFGRIAFFKRKKCMKSSVAAQRLSKVKRFLTQVCLSEGETTQRTKDGNTEKFTNSDG